MEHLIGAYSVRLAKSQKGGKSGCAGLVACWPLRVAAVMVIVGTSLDCVSTENALMIALGSWPLRIEIRGQCRCRGRRCRSGANPVARSPR